MKYKIDWEEVGEYFIKLWWRVVLVPSILSLVPIIPLIMISGCLIWFFTGRNTQDYVYNILDWYKENIWDKVFP